MPALRGSLTYARFFVEGALRDSSDDLHTKLLKSIRAKAMKPLVPEEDLVERSGWCRIGEPMELEFGHEDVFYNNYVNVGFRTDRWVIPGPVLRTKVREAEQAYLQKKGRERLTKKEKAELKDLVSKKLRRQTEPRTRVVDVSWSLEEGLVRFFSPSAKLGALLEELFLKTFGLKLLPESPYTLAARLGLSKAQEQSWAAMEPLSLAVEG
jgi:DNA recombination-dependent growth factor C